MLARFENTARESADQKSQSSLLGLAVRERNGHHLKTPPQYSLCAEFDKRAVVSVASQDQSSQDRLDL